MRITPLRIGLYGFALLILALFWSGTHNYLAGRSDPPWLMVDRYFYQPAMTVVWVGILLLILSAAWVIVRLVTRLFSK